MNGKPRFSKLKKKIENMFHEDLELAIHANVYTHGSESRNSYEYRCPRIWLQIDKQILFDFPGPFFIHKNPEDKSAVKYFEETPIIGKLIDEYLATAPAELMEKTFGRDRFGFTDLLKIADRRLGKNRLQEKYGDIVEHTPIGVLLAKRLTGTPVPNIFPLESNHMDLSFPDLKVGPILNPCLLQVRTNPLRVGKPNPATVPSVRVLSEYRLKATEILFSIEISDNPTIIEQHREYYEAKTMDPLTLARISSWIRLNREALLNYWQNGFAWNKEQSLSWSAGLAPMPAEPTSAVEEGSHETQS